jgi:Flavin containing amine oxidoreductase
MDILIIGAGITGLTAATYLQRQGHQIQILEKSDRVGGRVATDRLDGNQYDHGFQVLQTAYPELQGLLDLDALELNHFIPGSLLLLPDGKKKETLDPRRTDAGYIKSLFGQPGKMIDKIKLNNLMQKVKRKEVDSILLSDYTGTTLENIERNFSPKMVDEFFKPFFKGVFLDNNLEGDYRLMRFYLKMFVQGHAAIPKNGIEAIPLQLASKLKDNTILLNTEATKIEGNTVHTGRQSWKADKILIATEGNSPITKPYLDVPTQFHGVTQFYFIAENPPIEQALLGINADTNPSFNNICVYNYLHSSYSLPGTFLVSVTVNGIHEDDLALRKKIRIDLTKWFGFEAMQWELARTYVVKQAVPAKTQATHHGFEAFKKIDDNLFIAGDHITYGSLNGAMRSGRIAANELTKQA